MSTFRSFCGVLSAVLMFGAAETALAEGRPVDWVQRLGFEEPSAERLPPGWRGGPEVELDGTNVQSGRRALRISRSAEAKGEISSAVVNVPVDFEGEIVELRGFLKRQDVQGWTGLWLRVDGESGFLALDNMASRQLSGTAGWEEFSVRLPLDRAAKAVALGVLLSGQGTVWADGLMLLVDGKPVAEAPKRAADQSVLATDREFEAGSRINLSALTPAQIDALVKLGEVWGFLKYHHPRVTGGTLHWDFELFRILPRILAAAEQGNVDATFVDWIEALGPVTANQESVSDLSEERHLAEDAQWFTDRVRWGSRLPDLLPVIRLARGGEGQQYFVTFRPNVKNPDFGRELAYAGMPASDDGFRLLALYRFWNIIRYWFPYRDLIEEDWQSVLAEFIPRFLAARESETYRRELLQLIARVHDSHANLSDAQAVRPPLGNGTLPVRLRFVESRLVVTQVDESRPGLDVELQVGDVLLSIDGRAVEELVDAWRPFYAASNEWNRRHVMARFFGVGPSGEVARLRVQREGAEIELAQVRVPWSDARWARKSMWNDLPGPPFRLLSPDVAYVKLSAAKNEDLDSYVDRAQNTRGLIVDLRGYPTAFTPFVLGGRLVENKTPFARFTVASAAWPGRFVFVPSVEISPRVPTYRGKVVILVDEGAISSAEYQTMALRAAPGAVVIGSPTAGADGNVSRIPLPGGHSTAISGIGVFYPDKRPTQRVGVVPDRIVRPSIAGIRDRRDEVLEAALREILGEGFSEQQLRALVPRD